MAKPISGCGVETTRNNMIATSSFAHRQCRQSASGGLIFGSYLAAIASNEDSPHCPAARGKILWRKI